MPPKAPFFSANTFLRYKYWLSYSLCIGLLLGVSWLSAQDSTGTPPNIMLILVDDAALMDFGAYGGEAKTPNIDRLAQRGTMLLNHHASPMCAPSRSMLMTGFDSHLTGVPNLPVFTPPTYANKPGYKGILNDKVLTLATRLKRRGYRTYATGKWHLGHTESTLPSKRGFDRTYILDASGADNYEHRAYLPTQEAKPPWFKDGQKIDLPKDFYSSRNLVDEMIQFMEEETQPSTPFFGYLAFQAIHIPVQVPRRYTEKYLEVYQQGWGEIRKKRHQKAKELGIIPKNAALGDMLAVMQEWESLGEEEKKFNAKAMAANAGMLEAMDEHIGRLIEYLKAKGEFENTLFVVTSDNGPEASSVGGIRSMQMWMDIVGYHRDYERLGEKGSYNFIGPEFASAAASPSAYFKFYAGEGGLRVPLIFSGPGIPDSSSRNAFSFITDIAPTILELAGNKAFIPAPAGPMTGRSLKALIKGSEAAVYGPEDIVGMEAASQSALFKGNMKLVKNGKPYGDGIWRLYNLGIDPGETNDLAKSSPQVFEEMMKHYENYCQEYGVLEMPADYEALKEVQRKFLAQLWDEYVIWFFGGLFLMIGAIIWRIRKRVKKA
ncbi:MAG: sulfatase-like hydrolase/transferase [Bacteroidota bacterium]